MVLCTQVKMWEKFHRESVLEQKKEKKGDTDTNKIPDWLERYVEYKFHLYDRTGDFAHKQLPEI